MSQREILANELAELALIGLAFQVAGKADPRAENPLSALVDALEDPSKGQTIAQVVKDLLNSELESKDFFAESDKLPVQGVIDFIKSSEVFVAALIQIGLVTEKNREAVLAIMETVVGRAIRLYAEQYRNYVADTGLGVAQTTPAIPVTRRYDAEGRLR